MSVAEAQADKTVKVARRRQSNRLAVVATQIGILVLLLAAWQFAVTEETLPYFSRPTIVAAKLFELLGQTTIYRHISVTLSEIAIGYALGAGFGLSLGWEFLQSPFDADTCVRPWTEVALNRLHCAGMDARLLLLAFWLVALGWGRSWVETVPWAPLTEFLTLGIAYTA